MFHIPRNSKLSEFQLISKSKVLSILKNFQNLIHNKLDQSQNKGEILQQSNLWIRSTSLGLICSAVFGIGWVALAKTDEVIIVSGKLEPIGSVQNVQMPLGGIASEILVEEGEEVSKGQIVMKLDAENTRQRLKSLREGERLKTSQLQYKLLELEKYLQLNSEEIEMLTKTLLLQEDILARFDYLKSRGAVAELQYLEQMNRVNEIKGKLKQSKVERLRQKAAFNQQIQQIKVDLEDVQSKITDASVNLRYQVLRAPVKGIVFDLQPRGEGYVAQSTETVMKIVPFDSLQANVEIPSNQIGFVKKGMPADLNIDSFPSTDFGVLAGKVKSIGSDALPPSQLDNRFEYRYPAVIQLSSQQLELKDGKKLDLQVGMSITSNIKLRKVSYLQLLLGTFQEKVDSLSEL